MKFFEPEEKELQANPIKVKVDEKGRISIPAYIRRSFGLKFGSELILDFNLKENLIILDSGQSSVKVSTKDCGELLEKVQSKTKNSQKSFSPGSSPGSDPRKLKGDEDESI